MLNKHSKPFSVFLFLFFLILALVTFYPMWDVLVGSFMSLGEYGSSAIKIFPKKPNLDAYISLFVQNDMVTPFLNTLFVTIVGTSLALIVTSSAAYALSRKQLYGSKVLLRIALVTMLFSGGLMPTYMVVKQLGLINNIWALVLLPMVSAYNIFVMRSFFAGIPEAMEDSARIDGANDLTIFLRIMIPLSKPIIACMVLFIGVGYWNDLYTCVYYMNDSKNDVLQLALYRMVVNSGSTGSGAAAAATAASGLLSAAVSPKIQRMACVVVCTAPILCVYPFLQRYFVKGVMIGSIKE